MMAVKGSILGIACVAIVLSLAPLVAHAVVPQNPTPPDGPGGSGTKWKVVCQYDGQAHLVGYTCSSGGTESCGCP